MTQLFGDPVWERSAIADDPCQRTLAFRGLVSHRSSGSRLWG